MRTSLLLLIALSLVGCASTPKPGFKPEANLRAIAAGGCEIEFRKEEVWRPHGFNPWPFPRVAEFSTFISVPARLGDIPVSSIAMRDEIGTNLMRPWKGHRGHVVISKEKIVVEISELGGDDVWRDLELNGTYRIIER